ncbi:MAG: heme ABC exporter ATP-binding protein CcmA [Armatimonadaceae bacterium]
MDTPVSLRLNAVSKSYGARRVLRDVSLEVLGGEVFAIVGPNGSGKSTLLRIVAGLLRPTRGTVHVVTATGEQTETVARRRFVAYTSPEMAFYPELSGRENLLFFEAVRGRSSAIAEAACREALERVGLGKRGSDRVAAYSSGMRQRLRLAFAWLADAPFLLLDEPSLALDTDGVSLIGEMVAAQRQRNGVTLLATNNAEEAKLGDRAIVLG